MGSLVISFENDHAPVTLNNHFTRLTTVTGSVIVGLQPWFAGYSANVGLRNLGNALSRLENVGNAVFIFSNENLSSTDTAFESLRTVNGSLIISRNAELGTLGTSSFERLVSVGANLESAHNQLLETLGERAFVRLEAITGRGEPHNNVEATGSLVINHNPVLGNLALAFTNIPQCAVAGTILVADNGAPVATDIRTLCGTVENLTDWDVVNADGDEWGPPGRCDS